jgi:hypothetical protein
MEHINRRGFVSAVGAAVGAGLDARLGSGLEHGLGSALDLEASFAEPASPARSA